MQNLLIIVAFLLVSLDLSGSLFGEDNKPEGQNAGQHRPALVAQR